MQLDFYYINIYLILRKGGQIIDFFSAIGQRLLLQKFHIGTGTGTGMGTGIGVSIGIGIEFPIGVTEPIRRGALSVATAEAEPSH